MRDRLRERRLSCSARRSFKWYALVFILWTFGGRGEDEGNFYESQTRSQIDDDETEDI